MSDGPSVIMTIKLVFDDAQVDITPGERGLGEIKLMGALGEVLWESDNIPDEFWRVLSGALKTKGYAA